VWPVYLSTLRARLRCPAVLLVVSASGSVASWSAQPISLGHPDWTLKPLVLGPDQVPVVVTVAQAQQCPELSTLSVMAHHQHPDRDKILAAFAEGIAGVDDERRILYDDIVMAALPAAVRSSLEALVTSTTYQYKSPFARKYFAKGKAEGLLVVLEARGLTVSEQTRAQILECANLTQLDRWVRRALTVLSVEELLA
jgi:hypothetical protein